MIANPDIKLEKPEQYYGAVYGRGTNKQTWLYVIFALTIVLWVEAMFVLFPLALLTTLISLVFFVLLLISPIIPFVVGVITFTYNSGNFEDDIQKGRTTYAHNQFKTWVEQKYGVPITEEQALNLMNGKTVTIQLTDNKEKTVKFKNHKEMSNLFKIGTTKHATFEQAKTWDYDTDKLDFQLIVIKKQKPVKEKIWN